MSRIGQSMPIRAGSVRYCVLSALALVDGSAVHSRAAAGEFPFSAPVQRAFARVAEFAECGAVPFAVFERRWHSSGLFAGVLFPAVAAASGVPDFVRRLACPAAVDTFCPLLGCPCLSPHTDEIEFRSRGCSCWYEHLVADLRLRLLHDRELCREPRLLSQVRRRRGNLPALTLQRSEVCRDWQRRAAQGWNEPVGCAGFGQQLDLRGVPGHSFLLLPTDAH